MWFKNLQIFRLAAPLPYSAEQLAEKLARISFAGCSSAEMQSQGWDAPRGDGPLVHALNQQWLLALATEKKLLPSSVINQVAKAKAAQIEEEQGFAPGRKRMKEIKEQVVDELLPRAFGIKRQTRVWIDNDNRWLVVDASSPARADDVVKLLLKSVDKLALESLRTKLSPQSAMTAWLAASEAPKGFTIDQDSELKAAGEDKATIRYVRHTLDPEDVQRHIAAGKQCTRLALTWNDRVSFVLSDTLCLKRIKPLDVLDEEKDKGMNEDERFDADFTLMCGELAKLLDDLVYALDGEMAH